MTLLCLYEPSSYMPIWDNVIPDQARPVTVDWESDTHALYRLLNVDALNFGSGNARDGGDASSGSALAGDAGC